MPDIPNATPTNYNSSYTGPQIDAAVGAVLDKEASWDEAVAGKLPAGGEVGQVLEKTGAEDNAADWRTPPFQVRPNLLDNWYFVGGGSQLGDGVFPINQRGQTSYSTAGNCIDRWQIVRGSVELLDGGLRCTSPSDKSFRIDKRVPYGTIKDILGKTCTLSALVNDSLCVFTTIATESELSKSFTVDGAEFSLNLNFVTGWGNAYRPVQMFVGVGQAVVVKAVKLELGDTQTLAHQENGVWVLNELPDYWTELDKCKYYYERISGQYTQLGIGYAISTTAASFNTFVHPKARGNRTVSLNGSAYIWHGGITAANGIEISSINNVSISDNGSLYFTSPSVSGLTVGEGARLQLRDNTSYLEISVN